VDRMTIAMLMTNTLVAANRAPHLSDRHSPAAAIRRNPEPCSHSRQGTTGYPSVACAIVRPMLSF
jgi:hypothetical protein